MIEKELIPILEKIIDGTGAVNPNYSTPYGALTTPFDLEEIERCKALATHMNKDRPSLVVLIGIGGSSMGTLAILQAMLEQEPGGLLYATFKEENQQEKKVRFLCADTIDNDLSKAYLALVEKELKEGRRVLLIIVTKSGTTTETIINGSLFLDCLKKHKPASYNDDVVIITDAGSPLEKIAQQEKFALLAIPKAVGGRYSVFTAVGLFPLALLGIDIENFCAGGRYSIKSAFNESGCPSTQSGLMLSTLYEKGYSIYDLFVFSPRLGMLAQWYKQLIGESLGKKSSHWGRSVHSGMTPTVSYGTVDLHSVVQLYLAGPRNRVTTFLSLKNEPDDVVMPKTVLSSVIPGLEGTRVTFVKEAIYKGVCAAYEKEGLPFITNSFGYKDEYALGEFMMTKMVETIYLAALWNINPFDQPAVELYKQETRSFLKK